jgi:hypothetical protein
MGSYELRSAVRSKGRDPVSATEATPDGTKQMATAMEERRRRPTKLASEIGDEDHGNHTHCELRGWSYGYRERGASGQSHLNRCGTKVRIVGAPLVEAARTKSKLYGEE